MRERIEESWKLAKETDQTEMAARLGLPVRRSLSVRVALSPDAPITQSQRRQESHKSGSRNQEDSQTWTRFCVVCINFTLKNRCSLLRHSPPG